MSKPFKILRMDEIQRFLFKDLDIRGQHLSIDSAWQSMIKNRGYSKLVYQLFGELSALSIMLANSMKHPGKLTMQVQGDGLLSLMLVEVTHDLKIRGMVRSNGMISQTHTLDQILGDGQIIATLYNAKTDHSFQSHVPRNKKGLIHTFQDYFSQSEQLDTKLWVSSTPERVSAMLIQKMPQSKSTDTEDWNRITALANTTTQAELCSLSAEQMLHRLFHEEGVVLFEAKQVSYECHQDRARFEQIIFDLGEQDARALLEEYGEISIHNEICNEHVFFDEKDLDRIFQS